MPKKMTKKTFIEKAMLVHGDKYDYSKVVYVNSYSKIRITCLEHVDFCKPQGPILTRGVNVLPVVTLKNFSRKFFQTEQEKFMETGIDCSSNNKVVQNAALLYPKGKTSFCHF